MAENEKHLSESELQKLSDQLLDSVSGGYIHYIDDGKPHRFPKYEIIDRNGDVLESGLWYFNQSIEEWAEQLGANAQVITDEELDRLRRYRAVVGKGF